MKDHRKERTEARKKAEKLVSQMTLLEIGRASCRERV